MIAATGQPQALDRTQIDETLLDMVPAWQATSARFENDSIVASTVMPPFAIGYDSANHADAIVGHIPAKTIALFDVHDAGPTIAALTAKFRALPETAAAFAQIDKAVGVVGGFNAAFGWWGDTGIVVSEQPDGSIGGGLGIKPRDAAAADRLATTLNSLFAIGAPSQPGVAIRTVDHNGTKITVLDYTNAPRLTGPMPAGFKPEIALATNADITVIGFGQAFVEAVLDAGPGNSLGADARFQALVNRTGSENMGIQFIDIAAIRKLVEPIAQKTASPDAWAYYAKEIQPYLAPLDALIYTIRKDGSVDRGTTSVTAH